LLRDICSVNVGKQVPGSEVFVAIVSAFLDFNLNGLHNYDGYDELKEDGNYKGIMKIMAFGAKKQLKIAEEYTNDLIKIMQNAGYKEYKVH